jgi:hypothetical protein
MPLTWERLAEVTDPAAYTLFTVPDLLAEHGDAWAEIDDVAHDLTPLLDLYDGVEMPFPPDYPKMPGEPPRVQPSKKVAAHWDEHGNRVEGSER